MRNEIPQKTFSQFRRGNEEAYEKIFNKFISRVLGFIGQLVKSRSVAEELSQDVFVQLWLYRNRIESQDKIAPFLFRVAKNAALDYIYKQRSQNNYIEYKKHTETNHNDLGDEMEAKQLEDYIKRVVEEMPPQRKRIFEMSRFEHLEVKEIAKQLNLSPKTVYAHLNTALNDIREEIYEQTP